jgi:hypothetical protein
MPRSVLVRGPRGTFRLALRAGVTFGVFLLSPLTQKILKNFKNFQSPFDIVKCLGYEVTVKNKGSELNHSPLFNIFVNHAIHPPNTTMVSIATIKSKFYVIIISTAPLRAYIVIINDINSFLRRI